MPNPNVNPLLSDVVLTCKACGLPFHPWKYSRSKCCSRVCAGRLRKAITIEHRFWPKVDIKGPDECWPYKAGVDKDGYGRFWTGSREVRAHSVAWSLANRKPAPHGAVFLHSCDNPPCCNPSHVSKGTHADNHRDRGRKGRSAKGEQHGRHKLTESQAVEILARYKAGGVSQRLLAEEFSVTKSSIKHILKGRNWKHLQPVTAPAVLIEEDHHVGNEH